MNLSENIDFVSRGTRRIAAFSGFINVILLLTLWTEEARKLGFPISSFYGSGIIIYILFIWFIGFLDSHTSPGA